MNVLIIYDSMHGNTRELAEAMATAFPEQDDVRVDYVSNVPEVPADTDLLLVGGPTHAHGVSQPMQHFLTSLPAAALSGVQVAAFDTRFRKPKFLVGSASEGIAKRLRKHGGDMASAPESFFVVTGEGPLEDGEVERSMAWVRQVAEAAVPVG